MKRAELETAIRAAATVAKDLDFYLIGSQAVHAYSRRAPTEVLLSQECDLYPKNCPEKANLIATQLGRVSRFARKHGFYVDIVTPEIATLPDGWQERLKILRIGKIRVHCLEVHDLIISKLAAGRLRDLEFTAALFQTRLAAPKVVRRRIRLLPDKKDRARVQSRLNSVLSELS